MVESSRANSFTGGMIVQAGKLIVDNTNSLLDGGSLTIGDASFFSASPAASLPAVASPQAASTSTFMPATKVSSVLEKTSQRQPAVSAMSAAARAAILSQAAATSTARARVAAAMLLCAGSTDADSSGGDPVVDRSARIRNAIFLDFGRD